MDKRYVINTDTGRVWDEVCDAREPHVNGVGIPVARALPDMAARIAHLLNEREARIGERAQIAHELQAMGFDGAARFLVTLELP